jgi:DNA polymerase-3 subunit epsilon
MTSQLDIFLTTEPTPSVSSSQAEHPKQGVGINDEAEMVHLLEATGRYQILRKLEPRAIAVAGKPDFPLTGVIVDTETTGLDARTDEVIEVGLLGFTFNGKGEIGDVTALYGGLRQPNRSIPADIVRLTGITDALVCGQAIDMEVVRALIEPADLIIAHNAGFDRPFCEALSSIFVPKAWACSNSEIDWSARGFEGSKLGYLLNQSGYFHDGHRAVDDCFALLEVLAGPANTASPSPLAELYQASRRSRIRIFAENTAFDLKDRLKARGYRWSDGSDGRPKSWWIEVDEADIEEEFRFLRNDIYRRKDIYPTVQRLTAFDRFKSRR